MRRSLGNLVGSLWYLKAQAALFRSWGRTLTTAP